MFQQIKNILAQIKNFQLQDKVTQFNKLKNSQNKHQFNSTEGRLMAILRTFAHFQFIQDIYGAAYLLSLGTLIQPYFIRKNKILIYIKQGNSFLDIIIIEGIIKVQKIYKKQVKNQSGQIQIKQSYSFEKYISDGSFLSLMEYPQSQYKLTSHSDSKLIRFPAKSDIDPMELLKKSQQHAKQMQKNQEHGYIKKQLLHYFHKEERETLNFGLHGYDYNQLLFHMKLQKYRAKQTVVNQNQLITRIGFLLNGKIIEEDKSKQKIKFISKSNAILTLYKQDFTEQNKKLSTEQLMLMQPQFFGIQDYIQSLILNPFKIHQFQQYISEEEQKKFRFGIHKFHIQSMRYYWCFEDCQIIWIPLQIFALKFNFQTTLQLIHKWMAKNQLKKQQVQKQIFMKQITKKQISKLPFQQQKMAIQKPETHIFPKVNHHQLAQFQKRNAVQSKVQAQKQRRLKKFKKLKHFQLQENSLLGVTMRKYPSIEQLQDRFNINPKGRQYSRNKQIFLGKIQKKSSHNIFQEHSEQLQVRQEEEPIIMFPQKYKTSSLSPKLKKSLKQAEKQKHLFFNQNISKQNKKQVNNRILMSINSSNSLLFSDQNNGLSTIQSRKSLSSSKVSLQNPQQIYKGIIQKIAYKYPSIEQLLESYKNKYKKISPIKHRISQMKALEQMQKRRQQAKAKIKLKEMAKLKEGEAVGKITL